AALRAGQPQSAIDELQAARPYELANPPITFNSFFGCFYPVFVRGEAYLVQRKGAEAAAEFQRILDHRGLLLEDPLGARARVELGRAWAMAGDRQRRAPLTRTFWRCGRTPTPAFRCSRRQKQNTLPYVESL